MQKDLGIHLLGNLETRVEHTVTFHTLSEIVNTNDKWQKSLIWVYHILQDKTVSHTRDGHEMS